MEDIKYEDFITDTLKKYTLPKLKAFIQSKLYKPNKFSKKQEYIDFLLQNKNVIFGLEKQKNILRKLEVSKTKNYSETEVIVGIDEAGQGACAGDLYIGIVILPKYHDDTRWDYIVDSKQVSKANREILFEYIKEIAIEYVIHRVTPKEIDELNIHQAKMLGFVHALQKLKGNYDTILVDGPYFSNRSDESINNKKIETITRGDGIYKSIAAASILAKVSRDKEMVRLSESFPEYNWDKNKGYCHGDYEERIVTYGITEHHRLTYGICKTETKQYKK